MKQSILLGALVATLTFAACKSLGTPEDQDEAGSLWSRMQGYSSWGQAQSFSGLQPSHSPHGKFVQVYINEVGLRSLADPAPGTIIVKEGFGNENPDSKKAITVMERIQGYDPDNGDWFWARYSPSGELTHAGKVSMCADCHFDAEGDDFLFIND